MLCLRWIKDDDIYKCYYAEDGGAENERGIIGDWGRKGGGCLTFYKGHFNKPNLFYIEESLSSIDGFVVLDLIAT